MNPSARLLAWFDRNQRSFPWRKTRDPYAILVAEFMLQQTRAGTAEPYFRKFMERFPTLTALAAAEEDEVLATWSGLGYYRRARNLLATARRISATGGVFPDTREKLMDLPGVGPYTAAAIASRVLGELVPSVDGNVRRVVSRLIALGGDLNLAENRRRIEEAALDLLDNGRPGDSNQALMELGATVCSPRAPRCGECPLNETCRAYVGGDPEEYPGGRKGMRRETRRGIVAVVESRGRVLLIRRSRDRDVLGGMWEMPWIPAGDGENETEFASRYGGTWRVGEEVGVVRHAITYRNIELSVRSGSVETADQIAEQEEANWFTTGEIGDLPVSGAVRKVLAVWKSSVSGKRRAAPNRPRQAHASRRSSR